MFGLQTMEITISRFDKECKRQGWQFYRPQENTTYQYKIARKKTTTFGSNSETMNR